MDYRAYISIDPHIRFGRPCLRGTRISVYDVLAWLSQGMEVAEIIADFPELAPIHIRACLAYAADRERRSQIVS